MSEERAGYGGTRIRVTLYGFAEQEPSSHVIDLTTDPSYVTPHISRVNVIKIERLPDEPAAPHVEVQTISARVLVDGYYVGNVARLEPRDSQPVYQPLIYGSRLRLPRCSSLDAAVAVLMAAAKPAPAEPPMRYLGMEVR